MRLFLYRNIKTNFSYLIAGIILISHIIAYLIPSYNELISLSPNLAMLNLEIWRFISFPFAFASWISTLFIILILYYIGPKIESNFGDFKYLILLSLLAILDGGLQSIFNFGSNYSIKSSFAPIFFISSFFIFNFNVRKIRFYNRAIKNASLALLLVVSFVAYGAFEGLNNSNYHFASQIGFGFVIGSPLGFFAAHIFKRKTRELEEKLKLINNANKIPVYEFAEIVNKKFEENLKSQKTKKIQSISEDDYVELKEDTLNKILDKINDKGYSALDISEKSFLIEYSKKNQ